jgi:UDPglucose 6-dehydrogenase
MRREVCEKMNDKPFIKIAVIGSGYVGLVSGACLAELGHHVTCLDRDPDRIALLDAGGVPIYEPGLAELIARNVGAGRLDFGTDLARAVPQADVILIAVGTPPNPVDGGADLSQVLGVAGQIAPLLGDRLQVIVTKSTVPVGTGDRIEALIREAAPLANAHVASNPEFLREGEAIGDFLHPDRVLLGTNEAAAADLLSRLYAPLAERTVIMHTSRRSAELIKYAANAFLSVKISFINEIADLCEAVGAEVRHVSRGIGLDDRIGPRFLEAGPGYGGSCFPKDTLALLRTGSDASVPLRIVRAATEVNDARKGEMSERVRRACGGDLTGRRIALLGLSFKPNTDDVRDSPAIPLVRDLRAMGAELIACDPEAHDPEGVNFGTITRVPDPLDCLDGCDAAVIVTGWDLFRGLDLNEVRSRMRAPLLVDLRNLFDPERARAAGLTYHPVGSVPVLA